MILTSRQTSEPYSDTNKTDLERHRTVGDDTELRITEAFGAVRRSKPHGDLAVHFAGI
jgi:hypothetical protein